MAKLKKGDTIGGKTKKYSEAGKGDKNRVSNISKYAENWEKIFGKKDEVEENQEQGHSYRMKSAGYGVF